MAEIVASSFLSDIFEKLASAASATVDPYVEMDSEISKLEPSLFQIRNVLDDASRKALTKKPVKRWLGALHHLAYDIDDILDVLATEAIHRELDDSETETSEVSEFSKYSSWSTTMKDKINVTTTKLQDLLKEKDSLGLVVNEDARSTNKDVILHSTLGRQAEKEALVQQLLQVDESSDQNFSIVPILGMGGVGKTTLAKLLYDDRQVKDRFDLKAWVCVSDEFDSFNISKVIFQSVTGELKEFADLDLLQVALRDHLKEKRFLFVLDDVWSESYEDWETLVRPFHACAPGSKIIMTARKDQLIKKLGYNHLNYRLQCLSDDDAISLLAQNALGVNNFDSHLSLKPYGEGIVKKCGSLTLAVIALGRLLRTKKDINDWKSVLYSEIWRLKDENVILSALAICYHDLSPRLKQLFAYCSLFPRDFLFDKDELVQLWMAEGFLHQSTPSYSTEDSLGHEYFDELLSRSFFQHAINDDSLFVMHDLMHDLATSTTSEVFLTLGNYIWEEAMEKYRHMSFFCEEYVAYKKFEPIERAKSLRTFVALSVGVVESWQSFHLSNKILVDLLPKLQLLRVLCLRDFKISEVPESIGTLKQLRYLNLSRTRITHLPENVCNLYNLQTLILFGCYRLAKLPNDFFKLKDMRHFDIRDTPLLLKMPLGIGKLKNLQTLSKIIIGGEGGFKIIELKGLKNLCGKLSILGLGKVQNAEYARQANLSQKRLSELEVVWSDVPYGLRNEMLEKEVLNELKPHNDYLTKLEIELYGGSVFPDWVGDFSFLHLKHVSIRCCKACSSLPPLGQLPSLKELFIEGLDEVKVVGMDLLGTGLAFSSLEILSFKNMPRWEKWLNNSGIVFPRLQKLLIRDCPNLYEISLEPLPSLNVLEIFGCSNGVLSRLVEVAPTVTKLDISFISGLNDVVWRVVTKYLGAVEELSIRWCDGIRYVWESEAAASKVLLSLRKLMIECCGNLVSLGEKEEGDNCRNNLLTSLRMLYVSHCDNMVHCSCPDGIETLSVSYSTSITVISLPRGGQKLKSLDISNCNKLLEREWGGQMINISNMPMLGDVNISDWPNLKSIPKLNYLVHLTSLNIENCESLVSFPDNELSSLISLKHLGISNCPSMDVRFPRGIWPPKLHSLTIGKLKKPILEWGPQNFPTSLVVLCLYGDDRVSSCSQFSLSLPSSLTSLDIREFQKLESVSTGLQHLTSLHHLSFHNCPNMVDLPELLLPSLLSLVIWDCPNLEEKCSKAGYYWSLISHIPCIRMDP